MSQYSKINFIYFMQKWMDSVPGQTFLNYAYSWGAAVVILGTLFKLTHLPGANLMLFIGMGTEVVVFFISAFDRPFDKTTIDMTLDNHMEEGELVADGTNVAGTAGVAGVANVVSGSGPAIIAPSVAGTAGNKTSGPAEVSGRSGAEALSSSAMALSEAVLHHQVLRLLTLLQQLPAQMMMRSQQFLSQQEVLSLLQ